MKTNRARHLSLGVKNVELVSPEDILKFVPQLRADDIIGGTFCPTDGFVDPHSVMMGFMLKARERGVRLWLDTQVTGVETNPVNAGTANTGIAGISPADGAKSSICGQVVGVNTTRGLVSTRVVVNAAGPWAAQVAHMAGVALPVEPLRRSLVPTEPFNQLPQRFPMVIDMSTGFHFRREGKGILLAWNDPEETIGFKTEFDPRFVEKILTRAADRVPCLVDAEVNPRRAWAGLYEMTPDHHAIIGPAADVAGLYFVNGFSGHGVMHSPASGRITADLILKGHSDLIDTRTLGVERFSEGRLLEETAVL